jgi:hypothetical protein
MKSTVIKTPVSARCIRSSLHWLNLSPRSGRCQPVPQAWVEKVQRGVGSGGRNWTYLATPPMPSIEGQGTNEGPKYIVSPLGRNAGSPNQASEPAWRRSHRSTQRLAVMVQGRRPPRRTGSGITGQQWLGKPHCLGGRVAVNTAAQKLKGG